ncbi:hypothetical protein B0H16DRAFT_1717898 [Mycena metata]|uniref:F-box domain-containing protein n=1 Tax=Mycena metata TaxID=1033252 RepID=A0AAD7JIT2_9AGAR|nr:hypothetical protein B0H16DRAFT_1717898 [Mycena metata]
MDNCYPRKFRNSFFALLPVELLLEILYFACGSYHASKAFFVRTRGRLAASRRLWRTLVQSSPFFWNSLDLTPHRLVADVRQWTSHWTLGRLDLRLKCSDLYSLYYPTLISSAPRMLPSRTIAVISPFFSRCYRLCLVLEDTFALPDVLDRLRSTRGDHLQYFSLTRVSFPLFRYRVPAIVFNPRRLFAKTGLPMLRRLRLDNATVGWRDNRFYALLFDLVLANLVGAVSPTTLNFYRLLQRATLLRRFYVHCVLCEQLLDVALPPVQLLDLAVLDLRLGESAGVACVLSRCIMPSLTSLTLHMASDSELALFMHCANAMGSVVKLSINASSTDLAACSTLYSSFPRVRFLDLSHATPYFFAALSDRVGESFHFPSLEELSVVDIPLPDLRATLDRRAPVCLPLKQLTVFRAVTTLRDLAELEWFEDALKDGVLSVDPEPSSVRPWFDDL